MKLLDQVRQVLRIRHYSYRTEQCYVAWIEQYLRFCKQDGAWRHPRELAAGDVERFLSHLALQRRVSASTQNQALNALVFLYRAVLQIELGSFDALRAIRRRRAPTVLSRPEVAQLLQRLDRDSGHRLIVSAGQPLLPYLHPTTALF